ncbi:MAG: OB-fold nucleic acid binding domain-containing protein [Actinomycetota bacterium]|nr:OB-fold nucleic acid binding domain-containing protein [Actinomycetota bacterium]
MATDPFALRDADLRTWRGQFGDAAPIHELRPRHEATCVGVVHKIRLVPNRRLEVTVEDGSGRVTAVFTGRSNLPGLELGAGLRLSGTVAEDGDGGLVMRNPTWASVSEPYQ